MKRVVNNRKKRLSLIDDGIDNLRYLLKQVEGDERPTHVKPGKKERQRKQSQKKSTKTGVHNSWKGPKL